MTSEQKRLVIEEAIDYLSDDLREAHYFIKYARPLSQPAWHVEAQRLEQVIDYLRAELGAPDGDDADLWTQKALWDRLHPAPVVSPPKSAAQRYEALYAQVSEMFGADEARTIAIESRPYSKRWSVGNAADARRWAFEETAEDYALRCPCADCAHKSHTLYQRVRFAVLTWRWRRYDRRFH